MARRRRKSVKVNGHRRKGGTYVQGYCRRPPNRTIRPGSKRYKAMPF